MDWLTAESLVAALFDAMVEGRPLPPVPQRPEHGATDIELWRVMRAGGDLLEGRSFEWAVREDPRRVDLMVQAYIVNDFTSVLDLPRQADSEALNAWWYCRALQELRTARGRVDAPGLAELARGTWGLYQQLLDVSIKMRRPGTPAERMWALLGAHHGRVLSSFEGARAVTARAASAAGLEEDRVAWLAIGAVVDDMRASFLASAAAAGLSLEASVEEFGSMRRRSPDPLFIHAHDRWRAGHRAPGSSFDLHSFRLSGGRA